MNEISRRGNGTAPDLNALLRKYLKAILDADRDNRINRAAGEPLYAVEVVDGAKIGDADLVSIRAARTRAIDDLTYGCR